MTADDSDLRARLRALGRDWPAPLQHLEVAGSTNDIVKEAARGGAPAWTVARADRQVTGRGRHGRRWESPAGNLYVSVLLRPAGPPEAYLPLPLAVGVAVAEAAAAFGVTARLKWPNDVLVDGRKLGGILVEGLSGTTPGRLDALVVGVGVNVAGVDSAPAESTSMEAVTGRRPEVVALAAAVLARLTVWYDVLEAGRGVAMLAEWRRHAVDWWGRRVEARSGDMRIEGIARDVDASGALVLEGDDGARFPIVSGDVREVRMSGRIE